MVKKIAIVSVILVGVLSVFCGIVAMQPSEFRVQRSVVIASSASTIFPLINNLQLGRSWSPWEKLDPEMTRRYAGPESGAGAAYSWSGNDKVGQGRMTILDSKTNEKVTCNLENFRPFESVSKVEFELKPQDGGTSVEWSLTGQKGFGQKAACMFMSMDKLIGDDFDKGLTLLKKQVEAVASKPGEASVTH